MRWEAVVQWERRARCDLLLQNYVLFMPHWYYTLSVHQHLFCGALANVLLKVLYYLSLWLSTNGVVALLNYLSSMPWRWKESIIVPIHKKGDKTYCNNYRGISLLSTSYKILSNILLSRLVPYIYEIIGDHQCGFRRNISTTDQIFCIRQIMEKKWEYNEKVHQLFIDF
jgi:hypothetical protein